MKKAKLSFITILTLLIIPQVVLGEEPSAGTIIELSSIGIVAVLLATLSMRADAKNSPKLAAFLKHFTGRK